MRDYDGDFSYWQRKLDAAGVNYDITNLTGCTFTEIDKFVESIISSLSTRTTNNNELEVAAL